MKRFAALLLVVLLALGLAATPAQAWTVRWSVCYSQSIPGCPYRGVHRGWYAPNPRGTGNYLIFQNDCNVVVRNGNTTPAWSSNKLCGQVYDAMLMWQSDGNWVVYIRITSSDNFVPLWAAGTNRGLGWRYEMVFRSDNCLFINQGSATIWTDGRC